MRWVGKTRTVRIATDEGDRVYHSIEDLPAELRKVVKETLEGPNSETVLIANQEAFERLSQQFRELPERLEEVEPNVPESSDGLNSFRLWKWGVGGLLAVILTLWLLGVWIIQSGTW
jgi:hypothetical protein